MNRLVRSVLLVSLLAALTATAAFAGGPPEKVEGCVCPVFNSDSAVGEKNPVAVEIGGDDYTIAGPNVSMPLHATNGDGDGSPMGAHSAPGDTDYTAVWAGK